MKLLALLCSGILIAIAPATVEAAPKHHAVSSKKAKAAAPKAKTEKPTTTPAKPVSPNEDVCMERVRGMEPILPKLMASATAAIHQLLPDPAAYEKTLPPMDKVVAGKDAANLKNYGGLAEAFFFAGDKAKGEALYSKFAANSKAIFGPSETFQALVAGDMGLVYFYEKNNEKAEPLLLDSMKQLETHLTASVANNLITDYMCLSIMYDKNGKTADAKKYAKKLVDLAIKTRTQAL